MAPLERLPSLSDIRHVVFLMQENRSFDHYFGTLSGVRGFSDPRVATQPRRRQARARCGTSTATSPASASTRWATCSRSTSSSSSRPTTATAPTTSRTSGPRSTRAGTAGRWTPSCRRISRPTATPTSWPRWATSTGRSSPSITRWPTRSPSATPTTARCSGPPTPTASWRSRAPSTPPARAAAPSSSPRPAGGRSSTGRSTWTTMPEQLLDAGVTWKVYNDPTGLALFSPLPYFKAYNDPTTTRGLQLQRQAIAPNYPADFVADVAAGTLPQVSWIHGPVTQCEHPATAPQWGENLVQTVLDTLTSNPEIWAHTLFILHYDENGGFFDHVPPPVPPAGHARRVPHHEPAAGRRRRHRRPGRARLPRAVHPHVALHRGRLRGHRRLRPHVDAAALGEALRRHRRPTCRRGGAARSAT